jgi:hypothetical protein
MNLKYLQEGKNKKQKRINLKENIQKIRQD